MNVANKMNYKNIPITFSEELSEEKQNKVISSFKLVNYIERNIVNDNVEIKSIRIDKVNFFGDNVGFIYLESEIYVDGNQVPGITFIRGDSVGIMIVLNTQKGKFSVLAEQYRAPVGKYKRGIPAGMIDNEGQVSSTAIVEIEEEIGNLGIKEEELIYLTEYSPSSGGCDEIVTIYAVEKDYDYDELMKFQGNITGSISEKEVIKVHVIKYDELEELGGKSTLAYREYNKIKNK